MHLPDLSSLQIKTSKRETATKRTSRERAFLYTTDPQFYSVCTHFCNSAPFLTFHSVSIFILIFSFHFSLYRSHNFAFYLCFLLQFAVIMLPIGSNYSCEQKKCATELARIENHAAGNNIEEPKQHSPNTLTESRKFYSNDSHLILI